MIFDRTTVTGKVNEGLIADAIIRPLPNAAHTWVLDFICADGHRETMTCARLEKPKLYKSIDAALNDASIVGMKKAIIEMN